MPTPPFQFDLRVEADGSAGPMSAALAAEVLRQAGYAGAAAAELASAIAAAVGDATAAGPPWGISFRTDGGQLEVVVSSKAAPPRRIIRQLPG